MSMSYKILTNLIKKKKIFDLLRIKYNFMSNKILNFELSSKNSKIILKIRILKVYQIIQNLKYYFFFFPPIFIN